MDDPSESIHESLIGRRVMIRWPADSNFYEAVISEYNPVDVCPVSFCSFFWPVGLQKPFYCVYRIFYGWKYIQANMYYTCHDMHEKYKGEQKKSDKKLPKMQFYQRG